MSKINTNHQPTIYDVAIIGAGLAGSLCAHQLSQQGLNVCVIEKSRGSGGRAGSKRLPETQSCDLGTPFIQVSKPRTLSLFNELISCEVAAPWLQADKLLADNTKHFVGISKMSAISRYWLGNTPFITATRVHHIERLLNETGNIWQLRDDKYDCIASARYLIITAPAPQTAMILASTANVDDLLLLANKAGQSYQPQWAMWIEAASSDLEELIEPQDSPALRLIKDSHKTGGDDSGIERWVIQSTTTWAQQHINENNQHIASKLVEAFTEITQLESKRVGEPHRWLLSRSMPIDIAKPYAWNREAGIGLAGDWLHYGTAEGAILSALHLCDFLKNDLAK